MARILIVEDNADLRSILAELLGQEYEVETAEGGEEGVAMAISSPPDLVIMDLQLPRMDGVEAARRIREGLAPDRVPVLALTALAQERDPEEILATGWFDAYIAKPAPIERIRHEVRELLGTHTV